MRTEVRIAGFGGQGVILAGVIIGKAASLFDNKNAVQTQSYGPEARGGAYQDKSGRFLLPGANQVSHHPWLQS